MKWARGALSSAFSWCSSDPSGRVASTSPSDPAIGSGSTPGGAASIGWMAIVNFMIDSDFKWVLLGMALVWAASLALFWFETRGQAN